MTAAEVEHGNPCRICQNGGRFSARKTLEEPVAHLALHKPFAYLSRSSSVMHPVRAPGSGASLALSARAPFG